MTGVAERQDDSVGIAPDTVRVSVLVERMQIDVSLPIDVPVALLIPELVRLRDESRRSDDGAASADDARRRVWVLRRGGAGGRLGADDTLRTAGVGVDDLLHLVAERTLSAPTLYDDVVDAAAQLNRSRHQGWTSVAARRISLLGIALITVAWGWLVLTAPATQRTALLVLSGVAVLALIAAATALTRFADEIDAGMVLGWSALLIAATAGWVALTPYGDLARGCGCVALVLLCAAVPRLIGTGTAGYLAIGVFVAAAGAMLLARAAGAPAVLTGSVVAVLGTIGCLAVPHVRSGSGTSSGGSSSSGASATIVADLGARVAAERALRAGWFAGLAGATTSGAVATIRSAGSPGWSALVLAWVCAAALLSQSTRLASELERVAVVVPTGVLAVATAVVAPDYGMVPAVLGFAIVCAGALALAAAGTGFARGGWPRATLDYARYLAFAALVPVAFWLAVGVLAGPR